MITRGFEDKEDSARNNGLTGSKDGLLSVAAVERQSDWRSGSVRTDRVQGALRHRASARSSLCLIGLDFVEFREKDSTKSLPTVPHYMILLGSLLTTNGLVLSRPVRTLALAPNPLLLRMAHPAKTIDETNVQAVYRYLVTALRDPRRHYRFGFGHQREQALQELEALVPEELLSEVLAGNAMIRINAETLAAWCARWLSQQDLTRMWRALRQQQYKARHRVKRLALPANLYLRLSIYAEDRKLTLAQAVDGLLKEAESSPPNAKPGKCR